MFLMLCPFFSRRETLFARVEQHLFFSLRDKQGSYTFCFSYFTKLSRL